MLTARPYQKVWATNATDTSFASKVTTLTEPTNDGVVVLAPGGRGEVPCHAHLVFYGAGNDDQTFDARVIGWRRLGSGANPNVMWIPTPIAQFSCTLSTAVGVAGAPIVATERFVDTLILHASVSIQGKTTDVDSGGAASTGTIVFTSPANNLIAHARVPVEGFEKLEIIFDMTGATNGNALVTFT